MFADDDGVVLVYAPVLPTINSSSSRRKLAPKDLGTIV